MCRDVFWGRERVSGSWTGIQPMKASCIGAAGMTSGFGPSYQECLWGLPKANFSPPNILSCIKTCICIPSWKKDPMMPLSHLG